MKLLQNLIVAADVRRRICQKSQASASSRRRLPAGGRWLTLWLAGLTAVAAQAELLRNPGFEQAPGTWALGPGATVEKGGAAEGAHCLKLTTTRSGYETTSQRGIPTVPGKYYRLVYKVRGGEGSANATGYQRFMVFASWDPTVKDGKPQELIQQLSGRTFQDTFAAWQERTLEFFAPDMPSAGLVINCWIEGPGTAYFDDFRLTEVPPPVKPAFRLTLTKPDYRGIIFADTAVTAIQGVAAMDSAEVARLEITLRACLENSRTGVSPVHAARIPEETGETPVLLAAAGRVFKQALSLPDAPPVFSRVCQVKAGQVAFSIPAGKLKTGAYRLQARGLTADGRPVSEQTLSVLKVPPAPHRVRVREDNVFLVDGQPFFPIGLWRIPSSAAGYDEKQLYDLNRAGINTFLLEPELPLLARRLDLAAKYHLRPMLNVWGHVLNNIELCKQGVPAAAQRQAWETAVDQTIAGAVGHPALFGYFFTDEPLWSGFPLAPIRAAYDYFRQADPHHPIYINEAPRNTPAAVAGFGAASDFFGLDIYPVPEGPGNGHSDLDDKTLACVGRYTDRMREAVDDRKPVVMTLQGFAWVHLSDKQAQGIYPTFAQSRFMAYDAIVHGAKGLMYWGTQYILEEAFWHTLFRVTAEVRDLSAVLTSPTGKSGQVTVTGRGVVLLHKVCDQQDFIIAINESQTEMPAVFHTRLPHRTLHVVFEDRTVTMTKGKFMDVFAPQSVHVYASTAQLPPPLVPLTAAPDPGGEPAYLTEMKKRNAMVSYAGHASWIWFPGKGQTPNSRAFFRQTFTVPAKAATATLVITADDRYVCYLNGKEVGQTKLGWSRADRYDVTPLLREGANSLAIVANDAGYPPCGLLAELTGKTVSGETISAMTDAAWRCTETEVSGWTNPEFKAEGWVPVDVLGAYGSGAWGKNVLYMP